MFDAHIHVVPPRIPGAGSLHPRLEDSIEAIAGWLREEMARAGVNHALALGARVTSDDDPLGVERSLTIADQVPGLFAAGVADPARADPEHFIAVDAILATGRVKALKAYLGYLHYEPGHANYRRYYDLAERYNLPVIFHAGDTYSAQGKLRYSQPLLIDDVAVDHPNVRFIIAHMGNPWLNDAAAVVYKNVNVWADLSGLVVGDEWTQPSDEKLAALDDLRADLLKALRYCERPNRILFGSDWPLVPMKEYADLIAGMLPEHMRELIFEENARRLFIKN
ncbi:MAG: amidohydrolase family protein [Gemmataceae bacterium]